jgi:hypothetical protein
VAAAKSPSPLARAVVGQFRGKCGGTLPPTDYPSLVDLFDAKTRVAKALVESIFRRARYEIRPFRTDPASLRVGREDLSPDFVVTRGPDAGGDFLLEVKYRASIEQFVSMEMQRGDRSTFALARRQWPTLRFVLVTDRPDNGRSCFQIPASDHVLGGEPILTRDLGDVNELKIFPHNIEDHEQLLRRILALLTEA